MSVLPLSQHAHATQRDGAAILKLLHLTRGVRHDGSGSYRGEREFIEQADVCDHLAADETWAFVCVHRGKALFIGLDFDALFPTRLSIAKEVLAEMRLLDAAFATTGTTPDRGKVVICLQCPMPQSQAIRMRDAILERCGHYPDFGGVKASDGVDKFPTEGEGGLLRIGGYWKNQYNRLITLDGDVLDFATIRAGNGRRNLNP